jgi:hypothetical protein
MEHSGADMVARLPPLPGRALQALCILLRGADGDEGAAAFAALVLCRLVQAGGEQATRVVKTPGFVLVSFWLAQLRVPACALAR